MQIPEAELSAELSKISFLLENLYALVLSDRGARPADIEPLADDLVRQFMLPGTVRGSSVDLAALDAIREMAAHRVSMFFARVRVRMTLPEV